MKKIVWIYGLVAGVIVSVVMAISMINCCSNPEDMMGTGSMIIGYASMILAFSMIFVAVKKYRDNYLNGVISFGKAFGIGLLIALIASTMYVVVWALVYHFAIPNFMEVYVDHVLREAETGGSSEYAAKVAEMDHAKELYKNPLYFTLITYSEIFPVGLIVSLIAALILKKKKNHNEVAVA